MDQQRHFGVADTGGGVSLDVRTTDELALVVGIAGGKGRRHGSHLGWERAGGGGWRIGGKSLSWSVAVLFDTEHLGDRHEGETYSEGEEPDSHLVVAPLVALVTAPTTLPFSSTSCSQ